MTQPPDRRRPTVAAAVESTILAAVAYLPFLLSDPGRLASDSKQALYVDPGGFLADAAYLWDPGVGAGTVPHQHIGYLWPMGPWFWAFDLLGVPDWVAQRLWLGTLTLAAALGTRWLVRSLGLGRSAALAGALVYALTPYQFAFTARTSVLLLPWAGLPWLVELTRRAVHRGGWRHPAAFALVTFTVAGVNAPTLVLVGLAPLAVLVAAAVAGRWRAAVGAVLRIGVLTGPACAWWLAGLRVQGAYGIDVLAVTENLRTVAERSRPDDVLRGLGNWFFYGADRAGPAVDQAPYYDHTRPVVVLSFLLPVLALGVAVVLRWRHRAVAVALMAAAVVVAVGAWPYDDPSPFGRAFRSFAEHTSVGLAFRNSPRVVPVLVLGMALVLAAAVAATPARARRGAALAVGLLAVGALAPVARVGMLSDGVERPEDLPAYWREAAAYLDRRGDATRVLELPGADFAAYRWGNAIEPITPLLTDRPYLAREVLPAGSPESALLLDALDRRLQNGVLVPDSLAPVARLLGVGDIVVRGDLAYERFGLPGPDTIWSTLVDPRPAGLGPPRTFGTPRANVGDPRLDPLTPGDLSLGSTDRVTPRPPVAVLPVTDPQPVVRTAPAGGSIVLDGDADGIVDAAAAGIVDGRTLVLTAAGLDDAQIDAALDRSAHLVLTDSNRRRIQTWFSSIRDTRGPTERAGETLVEPTGHDARLTAFPHAGDDERTVVEQLGATVTATSAGGGAARPEDRPVAAFDGRTDTSWRVGGADPTGQRLTVRLDDPVETDRITLVQPQDGPRDRTITRVRVRVDGGPPVDVELGARSLTPEGQMVRFPARQVERVEVEILATSTPPFDPALANAVGFAEVGIAPGRVATEIVRLPRDLLQRAGARSRALALDVVLTRLRSAPDAWERGDEEATLARTFDLPTPRSFSISGTVRPDDQTPDDVLDVILGTRGTTRAVASSRLQGDPEARASRAVDGDPTTAWTAAFGATGPASLHLSSNRWRRMDHLELAVVADGRHSLPARVTVEVGRRVVARHDVGPIPEGTGPGHVSRVRIPFDEPVEGSQVDVTIDEVDPRRSPGADAAAAPLPVAVAEVAGTGFDPAPARGTPDPSCRTGLLAVDGTDVALRVTRVLADGAFSVVGCTDVELAAGSHRLLSGTGLHTGLDVDQLVLRSGPGGGPAPATAGRAPTAAPGPDATAPQVTAVATGRTEVTATVAATGEPFWFVLGQSRNDGWSISVDGGSAGPRTLVDGYANGWLVTPDRAGPVRVTLTWTPQRQVWAGMAVSALALVVALLVLVRTTPGPVPPAGGRPRFAALGDARGARSWPPALTAGVVAAVATALASRWWIGLVAGLVAATVARRPPARWGVAVAAPLSLAAARAADAPELGWLALALVVAVALADAIAHGPGALGADAHDGVDRVGGVDAPDGPDVDGVDGDVVGEGVSGGAG